MGAYPQHDRIRQEQSILPVGDLFLTIATGVLLMGIAGLLYNDYPEIVIILSGLVIAYIAFRAVREFFLMLGTIRDWWRNRK